MPKCCATRVCCACVDLITCVAVCYLTLRTGCEKHGRKILCCTPFRSGHMSAICARLSKGKVGVQRGRETAGVPSFLPSAVGTAPSPRRAPHSPALRRAQLPAEVQRKTPRPSGANPPAAVRVPRWVGAEKEPPVRGEPACGSSRAPVRQCRKGAARQGRTRLRQFACPAQPVQQKEPPVRGEPADAVRAPRSAGAGKGAVPSGRTRLRQFVYPGQPVQESAGFNPR